MTMYRTKPPTEALDVALKRNSRNSKERGTDTTNPKRSDRLATARYGVASGLPASEAKTGASRVATITAPTPTSDEDPEHRGQVLLVHVLSPDHRSSEPGIRHDPEQHHHEGYDRHDPEIVGCEETRQRHRRQDLKALKRDAFDRPPPPPGEPQRSASIPRLDEPPQPRRGREAAAYRPAFLRPSPTALHDRPDHLPHP